MSIVTHGEREQTLSVNTGLLQSLNAVTGVEKRHSRLASRLDKRSLLRRFSSLKNVRRCGVPLADRSIVVKQKDGVHHLSGLKTCGSPWACPVCAAKVRSKRSEHVEKGISYALDTLGWSAVMVTITIPHTAQQGLATTLEVLTGGWRSATGAREVKKVRGLLQYMGSIKATEVMLGLRGWHPHFHLIEFYNKPLTVDDLDNLHKLYFQYLERYFDKLGYAGLSAAYGVKIEQVTMTNGTAGRYIAKLQEGKTLALEMTRSDLKLGRAGGIVPFALLVEFENTGDMECIEKYNEYEQATFRKPCVLFSKGLRKKLCITDDRTDEEIAAEEVGGSDVVYFSRSFYWQIIKLRLEARCLIALDTGGVAALIDLFRDVGIGGGYGDYKVLELSG